MKLRKLHPWNRITRKLSNLIQIVKTIICDRQQLSRKSSTTCKVYVIRSSYLEEILLLVTILVKIWMEEDSLLLVRKYNEFIVFSELIDISFTYGSFTWSNLKEVSTHFGSIDFSSKNCGRSSFATFLQMSSQIGRFTYDHFPRILHFGNLRWVPLLLDLKIVSWKSLIFWRDVRVGRRIWMCSVVNLGSHFKKR